MQWTKVSVFFLELIKVLMLLSFFMRAFSQPFMVIPISLCFLCSFIVSWILEKKGRPVVVYWLSMAAGVSIWFFILNRSSDWLSILSVFAGVAGSWFRGAWLAKQAPDHQFCLARFDEGLWIAFIAYSVAALIHLTNDFAGMLLYPLGFFSILSLGLSKTEPKTNYGLSPRLSSSMLSSFALVSMLAIIGLSLIVPLLVEPVLWTSGRVAGVAFTVLRYFLILMDRFFILNPAPSQSIGQTLFSTPATAQGDAKEEGIVIVILVLFLLLVIIAVLALLVAGLVKLVRYFTYSKEKKPDSDNLKLWLRRVYLYWSRLLKRLRQRTSHSPSSQDTARQLYSQFQTLGRRLGYARIANETAREYERRLVSIFPKSSARFSFVVAALERVSYGAESLDSATEKELRDISKKLSILNFVIEGATAFSGKLARRNRGFRDQTQL